MPPAVTILNVNTGQVVTIPAHKAASLGAPWVEVEAAPVAPEPAPEPEPDADPVEPRKRSK